MESLPEESALSRLEDGDICMLVLQDGRQREAFWSVPVQRFFFISEPLGAVSSNDVDEWWPTGVRS